jgi:hypothetical protein
MTIHSDWSRILHDECSAAFTPAPPRGCAPKVGIIDGHLQLMRLDPRMGTWECFVRNQFLKPIQTLFNLGCPRVVLCFDNYAAVPTYKTMTQNLRTNKFEIRNFGPDDELPPAIPDDPITYLMNRNFKLKLIQMLCEQVPLRVPLQAGQEFILDYKRVVQYSPTSAASRQRVPVAMSDMASMGESDVKFCRYVTKYGNALVHAIDGDYMAIALLYYAQHDVHMQNKIFIYRQLSVLHSTSSTATGKRKRKQAQEEAAATTTTRGQTEEGALLSQLVFFKPSESSNNKQQPPKCWVNMQMVYSMLSGAVRKGLQPTSRALISEREAVLGAVFLMLCAGTDFSRSTPLLGPKRMWDALPQIAEALSQAMRDEHINEERVLNQVIARMYALNYTKHVRLAAAGGLESVLRGLQGSKLSEGTKQKLPSMERMRVTLRNVVWVIKYWETENGAMETPEDGRYGFVRDAQGELTFADMV